MKKTHSQKGKKIRKGKERQEHTEIRDSIAQQNSSESSIYVKGECRHEKMIKLKQ